MGKFTKYSVYINYTIFYYILIYKMISFVTSIKLCKYYENYDDRLVDYIENITLGCNLIDISSYDNVLIALFKST